ncbi:fibronectin type III domain-containing protein [Paenibacillus sp. L3-i20]|uniref:fibronectin type III domain-containing protein n=1 Tax=Paenibacillus sp. L3-i20 TaxID=2905833 RepID=UPI001EDE4276|nr:fibronectin type III domain-containing protein [Paenibacillus sp. L3-i20]
MDKPMIRIGNTFPAQGWNQALDNGEGNWEIVEVSGGAYKAQSVQLVSSDYFSGTGNMTKVFDEEMHGVAIFNASESRMTFTIDGVTRPVFEQIFKKPFKSMSIVASGEWFIDVLQQYGASAAVVITPPIDVTAPENVTGLEFMGVTETTVTLQWVPSVSPDTVGYDVYRGQTLIGSVAGTSYNVTNLTQNTQYTFYVKARDEAGNVAIGTSIVVTTVATPVDSTPPLQITQLVLGVPTSTSIPLSWKLSSSTDVAVQECAYSTDGNNFNIVTNSIGATASSYTVSGLTPATKYTLRVVAIDGSGNRSIATTIQATTANVVDTTSPVNVTNLTATNPTETTVTLTWIASVSSDIASYDIFQGSTFLTNVTGTSYEVTGLTASTQYIFTVKAKDLAGNVANGTSMTATTQTPSGGVGHISDASLLYFS